MSIILQLSVNSEVAGFSDTTRSESVYGLTIFVAQDFIGTGRSGEMGPWAFCRIHVKESAGLRSGLNESKYRKQITTVSTVIVVLQLLQFGNNYGGTPKFVASPTTIERKNATKRQQRISFCFVLQHHFFRFKNEGTKYVKLGDIPTETESVVSSVTLLSHVEP